MLYKSKILDLRPFGIYKINSAMLTADADDGLLYRVSFDAGRTWRVVSLNSRFRVPDVSTQLKVEIKFPKSTAPNIDILNAAGVFPLTVGTQVYFSNNSGKYSTIVGASGRYSIALPPGIYQVYYNCRSGSKVVLLDDYNPEFYVYRQPDDLDKENTIQQFMSDIEWATFSVYDTFKDTSKMEQQSTAVIDLMHNLKSPNSTATVKYWALVFDTITP